MTTRRQIEIGKMVEEYGPRCPEDSPGCPCCDAWAFFDHYGTCPTYERMREFAYLTGRKG